MVLPVSVMRAPHCFLRCMWNYSYWTVGWDSLIAGNVGADHAIFEQGASAGNVGTEMLVEQKKANPVALLLSSAMMLRHLRFPSFADRLETAVKRVIAEGKYRTKDLGGYSTTQEVVDAVIEVLDWPQFLPPNHKCHKVFTPSSHYFERAAPFPVIKNIWSMVGKWIKVSPDIPFEYWTFLNCIYIYN